MAAEDRQDGFELRRSGNGKFYFVQKDQRGEVVKTSETYCDGVQAALDDAFAAGADPSEGPLELVRDES